MQATNGLVVLVVMALFGLVFAAPAEEASTLSGVEQLPAMLVRSGPAQLPLGETQPRRCTNSACFNLCRGYGWATGFCLDAVWCLCHN